MGKHSFNADETSETVIGQAERVLRDKTEFFNRCIAEFGRKTIEKILAERNAEFQRVFAKESPEPPRRAQKSPGDVPNGKR